MFGWFISLNATDKIALFALVVALYGAILSTILYNKEKFNLKFINLGINFVTLSPNDVISNDFEEEFVTYSKNLYTIALLVRINNCSKNPITITDFILNKKHIYNSFSSKDYSFIPTDFEFYDNHLIKNSGKYIKDKLITPLVKLEPLSSCEGFIIFDNLNNIPKKFNLIINAVPKSKKFKFNFKIDKDFRNQIIK